METIDFLLELRGTKEYVELREDYVESRTKLNLRYSDTWKLCSVA